VSAPVNVDVEATTEGCRYCWMCRQACPVGHVTARETYTPHAWALSIESVKRGQLQWTPEVTDVLWACADCGLCQAHCVTDRPLPEAIVATRTGVAARGQAVPAVRVIDEKLRAYANPYHAAPPISRAEKGATALFVGDAGTYLESSEIAAAVRLLSAAGREVVRVGEGQSTGLVASSLGLRETGAVLAARVIDEIVRSGATEVLVLGAGDRWTFEHVYPSRLGVTWPAGVTVRDVADVLVDAQLQRRLSLRQTDAGTYAYVDPCHTARTGRSRPAPRALLKAAFGGPHERELFWREHRGHPCGSVGGLQFTHPEIADRLSDARLEDGKASGASWLVTDDPACLHHLRGRSANRSVPVRGLYEVLAERL
jgi:Fe-S oxidoreductase